jgi:hypothetical protein
MIVMVMLMVMSPEPTTKVCTMCKGTRVCPCGDRDHAHECFFCDGRGERYA